ncbi:DUF6869 domain-containing protein [Lysobacter enzymogenes]|uniref:DUF6869 domain-containing protein n=1 Tax=Lysobacter enzymogenes TaxID=69 RepID=UPI00089920F2|nr:hypothetical protein [Lysobacter enzymogenes]SDW05640.1 hypothetical protein SAMN05421681_10127 [Lysobacter enzymogenes]
MHPQISLDTWIDAFIEINLAPDGSCGPDHPLWWANERTLFPLKTVGFETMWQFVIGVLARKPPRPVLGVLAAGPLEDMIAHFGDYFIERIEDTARHDPEFRDLLHGVWKNRTPDVLWERVKLARGREPLCADGLDYRPE